MSIWTLLVLFAYSCSFTRNKKNILAVLYCPEDKETRKDIDIPNKQIILRRPVKYFWKYLLELKMEMNVVKHSKEVVV